MGETSNVEIFSRVSSGSRISRINISLYYIYKYIYVSDLPKHIQGSRVSSVYECRALDWNQATGIYGCRSARVSNGISSTFTVTRFGPHKNISNIMIFFKMFQNKTIAMKDSNVRAPYRAPYRGVTRARGALCSTAKWARRLAVDFGRDVHRKKPLQPLRTRICHATPTSRELSRGPQCPPNGFPPLKPRVSQVCRVTLTIAPGADDEGDDQNGKNNEWSHFLENSGAKRKMDAPERIPLHNDILPIRSVDDLTGIEQCRRYLSEIGMADEDIDAMIEKYQVTRYMPWDYRHPLAPNKRKSWDPRLCDYPCCSEYPTDAIDEDYSKLTFDNTRVIVLAHAEPKTCFGASTGVHMLPMGGGFIIDQVIQNLRKSGISKNMYVTSQYSSYHLNRRLHRYYSYSNGASSDPAVKVLASHQTGENKDWLVSDVDCLQKNLDSLINDEESIGLTGADEFIICTGHSVHDIDYRGMISFHRSRGSDLTVCATSVPKAKTEAGISMDFSNRLVAYKDPTFESFHSSLGRDLKSTGIFVFNPRTLQRLLNIMNDNDDFIEKAFEEKMKVNIYTHAKYWHEIETVKDYYNIMLDVLAGRIRKGHHLPVQNDLPTPVFMGMNAVDHSFIGGGSYLSGDCSIQNSFVGNNLILGQNVRILNSVLMHCHNGIGEQMLFHERMTFSSHMFDHVDNLITTVIGDNVKLENCVVDENVHVGPGSIITNVNNIREGGKDGSFIINEGIVYLLKDCYLPANTVI